MADVLKKFGRYFLLDALTQGGMAEIYRARQLSSDGNGRVIVIKRIQAGFGANEEFKRMFIAEKNVTMAFNHPNVVQIYDAGEENGQPYIGMEWVDGCSVKQLMNRFIAKKGYFPVPLALHIIGHAAAGLHYAHHFKDKATGNALNVVHRDISPQNIMVTYDEGLVKVIDFGIAKAETNQDATQAGIIKGKPSYLSPEQIDGLKLDGRSDLFALGAVFWELLVGKKLFQADSDLAVLRQILAANTHVQRPSEASSWLVKELPDAGHRQALDNLVRKVLFRERDGRHKNGSQLKTDVQKLLAEAYPDFNPEEYFHQVVRGLFQDEIVEDRKNLRRLLERANQLLVSGEPEPGVQAEATVVVTQRKQVTEAVLDFSTELETSKVELDASSLRSSGTQSRVIRPGTQQVAQPRSPATRTDVRQAPVPQAPQQKSDGLPAPVKWVGAIAAAAAGLFVFWPQTSTQTGRVIAAPNAAAEVVVSAAAVVGIPGKSVLLKLNISPGGIAPEVTLQGASFDRAKGALVLLDAPLELNAVRAGYKPLRKEFTLESRMYGSQPEVLLDVAMEPIHFGFLTLRSTPTADAVISIDGEEWHKKTPFESEVLPLGRYKITLKNSSLGMGKVIEVDISEGKVSSVEERLEVQRSD